jgi:phosphatidylinositol alpha-mannosyltransferase
MLAGGAVEIVSGLSRRVRIGRSAALALAAAGAIVLVAVALHGVGLSKLRSDLSNARPGWLLLSLVVMMAAMCFRAVSWLVIVRTALPETEARARNVTSATMIGVLISAALPGRVGEPARALVLARHLGPVSTTFPVLLGTLVAQTALNIVALLVLAVILLASTSLLSAHPGVIPALIAVPAALLGIVLAGPALLPNAGEGRLGRALAALRRALLRVRAGLSVFRGPREAALAGAAQLGAWALQVASVYAIARGLGLTTVGWAASAAVLFAVNVSAVVPVTPSNVGVFQAAVIAVLTAGYGTSTAGALALGIVLQAVEVITAVLLGAPALLREGLRWSQLRAELRAAARAESESPPAGSGTS